MKKLTPVCSEMAYQWLQNWIKAKYPNNNYPLKPDQYFYSNTNHREYLSKFIESVITLILRNEGADVIDSADKGQKIDTSFTSKDVTGREQFIRQSVFVKSGNVNPGRADRKAFVFGRMVNFEVKVAYDKQSDLQLKEQARAEKNGEVYLIIKTVDDFIVWFENAKQPNYETFYNTYKR